MVSTDLPPSTSPDLHLVIATEAENLAQLHSNSSEWSGALSLAAYLKREELLISQDLTKEGGLTPWMLVHQPAGSETRKVLCGCESIKKKALLAKDGEVKDAVAHGIASVFCPPANRGMGYAGRMMEEVGKKLGTWQAGSEGSAFSVLYSDIGKEFYKARGWENFPSAHIELSGSIGTPEALPQTRQLIAGDLMDLCESDERLIRSRLARLKNTDKTAVALIPDVRTLDWHHAREDFIARELHSRQATVKGAIVGSEPGKRAWCIWTRVWTNPNEKAGDTLHILRLAAENEAYSDFSPASESSESESSAAKSEVVDQVAALLSAAQREAKDWSMEHVEIWNPTNVTLAAARILKPGAEVTHRQKESIAALRWYGEGSWEDVEWVCNEKFGWC